MKQCKQRQHNESLRGVSGKLPHLAHALRAQAEDKEEGMDIDELRTIRISGKFAPHLAIWAFMMKK
jgi:hypothetical protein